jgi:hypothetical protein
VKVEAINPSLDLKEERRGSDNFYNLQLALSERLLPNYNLSFVERGQVFVLQ